MNKRTAGRQGSALILLLAMLIVAASVAAVAVLGRGPSSVPTPSDRPAPIVTPAPVPSGTPIATPSPTPADPEPSDPPSPEPTEPPTDAMPITVELETLTPHHVYVDIVDPSFSVVRAVSGRPTANASVAEDTLRIENLDERTLRLTWVDRPGDNALALHIDREANRFVMIQPEHDLDGDTVVHDRVLILTFRDAIAAGDIEAFLQGGFDTAG
jgi:hypothetical protein